MWQANPTQFRKFSLATYDRLLDLATTSFLPIRRPRSLDSLRAPSVTVWSNSRTTDSFTRRLRDMGPRGETIARADSVLLLTGGNGPMVRNRRLQKMKFTWRLW